ncbi:protein ALP1-like [Benincasa hispida]|uniref:protein ALP1-like n=1 Tax=Benincasa hispida TaxID=102211 RepID=UPI0019023F4A|nr:protein ALP1-like [Benincasa hispida]
MCTGYYYLCDAGYPNAEGFLAPYRGERYHLSDWRGVGNAPTTAREFFNMKHSSARNVIERAFGLLKGRWAILRGKSFYPIQVQCRTITECCLIHNLITKKMGIVAMFDVPDEENSALVGLDGDHIEFIESSEEWTKFRDDLAVEMFTQWQRA